MMLLLGERRKIYREMSAGLTEYIGEYYNADGDGSWSAVSKIVFTRGLFSPVAGGIGGKLGTIHKKDSFGQDLDEPFSVKLLRMIDQKGMKDPEVYRRANLDRRTFAKIRRPEYRPGKRMVLALAIALRLSIEEADSFLKCAGYALSSSIKADVIVQYFIVHEVYDIHIINAALYDHDQAILGG